MGLTVTLWLAGVGTALAAFCGWRGARPPALHRGPRLVPWRFLMLLLAAVALMLVVHLVNLLGFTTGRR